MLSFSDMRSPIKMFAAASAPTEMIREARTRTRASARGSKTGSRFRATDDAPSVRILRQPWQPHQWSLRSTTNRESRFRQRSPGRRNRSGAWVRGQMPLEKRDARVYYTEAPPHEFQEILDAAKHHRFAREAAIAAQLEDPHSGQLPKDPPPSTPTLDLVPARYIGSAPVLFATHPGRVIEYGETVMVTSASLARPDLEAIVIDDIDDPEDEDGSA